MKKSLTFFITPVEFEINLKKIINDFKPHVYLQKYTPKLIVEQRGTESILLLGNLMPDRIILTNKNIIDFKDIGDLLLKADSGWVMIDVPLLDKNSLSLITIATKSINFDFFNKTTSYFRKLLNYPVWVWNIKDYNKKQKYNNFGYTNGVKDMEKTGIELCQRMVENIRFSTVDSRI